MGNVRPREGKSSAQDHQASQLQSQGFRTRLNFYSGTCHAPGTRNTHSTLPGPQELPPMAWVLVRDPSPVPSTFPDKDFPISAMVQDEAVLGPQGPLGEGVLISNEGDWHGARAIGDLRGWGTGGPEREWPLPLRPPQAAPPSWHMGWPTSQLPPQTTWDSNTRTRIPKLWGTLRFSFPFSVLSKPHLWSPHTCNVETAHREGGGMRRRWHRRKLAEETVNLS